MNGNWNEDIVRLLTNWAEWMARDRHPKKCSSLIYNLGPKPPHYGNTFPIIDGEAQDVDRIVGTLPVRYQRPLQMHYGQPWRSDRSKANGCYCCLNTYKARLNDAHALFAQAWYGRHEVPPVPPVRMA
jgi:hypothetical protein